MKLFEFEKGFTAAQIRCYFNEMGLGAHSVWPLAFGDRFFVVSVASAESKQIVNLLPDHAVPLHLLQQVHSSNFVMIGTELYEQERCQGWVMLPKTADAWLWVDDLPSGQAFAIYTADCIPAYLSLSYSISFAVTEELPVTSFRRGGALMHLGRKGIAAGLLRRCAKYLANDCRSFGEERAFAAMCLHLGPAIGACCYEVPLALAKDFCRNSGISEACIFPHIRGEKSAKHVMLDLKRATCEQAQSLGIAEQNIYIEPLCTRCQTQDYLLHPSSERVCYSYRCGNTEERIYTLLISL